MLKVKEPQPAEVEMLRAGQTLFTYLHLAAEPELTRGAACESGATCIAYETVEDAHGRLPLLAPMSEVAGKIATQAGAFMLEKPLGGRGILLGGVPGVAAATVLVIGGGVVGMNAAFIAIGMEADVFVFDRSIDRLRELEVAFGGRASTVYSSTLAIEEMLPRADLVIGAVLVHGGARAARGHARAAEADEARTRCSSTSRSTRAAASRPRARRRTRDPTYEVDGITHYCVDEHAGRGADHLDLRAHQRDAAVRARAGRARACEAALDADPGLRSGVNVRGGRDHPPGRRRGARHASTRRSRRCSASELQA